MQYIDDNGPDGNPGSLQTRAASTDIEVADDMRMKHPGHGQQSIGTKEDQQADDTSLPFGANAQQSTSGYRFYSRVSYRF